MLGYPHAGIAKSDHLGQLFSLCFPRLQTNTMLVPNYSLLNLHNALCVLQSINWSCLLSTTNNVDDLSNIFTRNLLHVLRLCTMFTRRIKQRSRPLLKFILRLVRKKSAAWSIIITSGLMTKRRRSWLSVRIKAIRQFYLQQEGGLLRDRNKLFMFANDHLGGLDNLPVELLLIFIYRWFLRC